MEVVRVVGGLLLWSFVLGGLYLKTVEATSRGELSKVKRKRFVVMVALWVLAPALGGAMVGSLVADSGAGDPLLVAAIGAAIVIPWLIAIRLQIRWGNTRRNPT